MRVSLQLEMFLADPRRTPPKEVQDPFPTSGAGQVTIGVSDLGPWIPWPSLWLPKLFHVPGMKRSLEQGTTSLGASVNSSVKGGKCAELWGEVIGVPCG